MNVFKRLTIAAATSALALMAIPASADTRIALVVKSLGNGFFDAAAKGADEAAAEIGGIEIIYTGPTAATAEGQIEIVNALIAQRVDAIAISANDPDALVPVLKKAMDRGITVISWDSGVAAEGRQMHLNPSDTALIGETIIKLAADYLPDGGDVAILSASSTAANQNAWIDAAKEAMPTMFPNINLVATVYGDDDSVKSTDEAKGLIAKVNVTGLALPSEFKQFIDNGSSMAVALWNPIDLGYSAVYIANALASGSATAEPGATISIGHVGEITLDESNSAAMAAPFTFDASNIEAFSKIY